MIRFASICSWLRDAVSYRGAFVGTVRLRVNQQSAPRPVSALKLQTQFFTIHVSTVRMLHGFLRFSL